MKLLSVFLTNLGKYNEGELIGEWLDLPTEEEKIKECLERIGVKDNTEYEEYFITDHESEYGIKCDEYTNINVLNSQLKELAEVVEKSGNNPDIILALLNVDSYNLEELTNIIREEKYIYYRGSKLLDVAEEMLDNYVLSLGVPFNNLDNIKKYLDYETYADELKDDSYYECDEGVIYIN